MQVAGDHTIVDPTVIGLATSPRIQYINAQVDINIVVATGIHTYTRLCEHGVDEAQITAM